MKTGIITLVSDNYGNKFQNYAVEQIFSQYGDVETFKLDNLHIAPSSEENGGITKKIRLKYIKEVLTYRLMYKYDLNRIDRGLLYNLIYTKKNSKKLLSLKKERSRRFEEFSKKELHISPEILNRENTTKEWADGYDCFVCGSDQIWNPTYSTTSELAFCSFAPEKTICLSPSFGVSQIPDYRVEEYSRWLTNIRSLSVREEAGKKIIKELTGRDAELLLDPTMLISVDKWNSLCKKPENKLPEKYILCYFLGKFNKQYRKKVNNFAKKHNLPVVMLFDIMSPQYYTYDPAEVLYAIKNAEYVLTDSFHGSVFSILFHKNFYVFDRNEGGLGMNSRTETLLNIFDLSERTQINNETDIDQYEWEKIDKILNNKNSSAEKFLKNAIKSNQNDTYRIKNLPPVYSGYLRDINKLSKSASGGAATAIAESFIKDGGVIFGVGYSNGYKNAEYILCETYQDLERIKGSKYFEIKKDFSQIEKELNRGKKVLFIGLGCDVAAVIAYCKSHKINDDNLFTIELLCHGPMAAIVHQKFIEDLEIQYNSKVKFFTSRSKKNGWTSSSYLKAEFENGKTFEKPMEDTDYGYVFSNYALPKCEKCKFKGENHPGDLCIGDHWGLKPTDFCWNKDGVSIIVEQSLKGKVLIDSLDNNFVINSVNSEFVFKHNPMYFRARKSLNNYKDLLCALENKSLHTSLKKQKNYKAWGKNVFFIRFKRFILNFTYKR